MDRFRQRSHGKIYQPSAPKFTKKNIVRTRFGKIEIAKSHSFSKKVLGSRTSPLLQEFLVLMGCEHVYEKVPELLGKLLGITVSTSQTYRSTLRVANQLDISTLNMPSACLQTQLSDESSTIYGMVDGSMLLYDEGWQESKLGRVFEQSEIKPMCQDRNLLARSEYVVHRGHYSGFTKKFEQLLPPNSTAQKVFINDGALWIGDWLDKSYPEATQILDFYHVVEKLAEASKQAKKPEKWLIKQKERLKSGEFDTVKSAILRLSWDGNLKKKLLTYMDNNRHRMNYQHYLAKGFMIGSGPIESAHRTVLQKRMKLSGQRWGQKGGDRMADLRVAIMSGKNHLITNIFRKAA